MLLDVDEIDHCLPILSRLLAAAATPVDIEGRPHQVSASVGLTLYPQGEEVDADQLLRQADQAMYQAKLAGKNRFHLFDPEQDRNLRGHHASIEHIRQALLERQFVLHYQPKIDVRAARMVGAEALMRWQRGNVLVPPADFIPLAEENNLINDVGEWVLNRVCTEYRTLSGNVGDPGRISLNLSLQRTVTLTERVRMQFRMDANNILNHVNIMNFGTVVNSITYGVPTAAGTMRNLTATVRLNF